LLHPASYWWSFPPAPGNFRFQTLLSAGFYLQIHQFLKQFKPFVFYFGDSHVLFYLGFDLFTWLLDGSRVISVVISIFLGLLLISPLRVCWSLSGCIPLLQWSRVEINSSRLSIFIGPHLSFGNLGILSPLVIGPFRLEPQKCNPFSISLWCQQSCATLGDSMESSHWFGNLTVHRFFQR
jgi:hypothetical protein